MGWKMVNGKRVTFKLPAGGCKNFIANKLS